MNARFSRKSLSYFWIAVAFLLGSAAGYLFNAGFCKTSINKRVGGELELYFNFRKLWSDHVFWTRSYIVQSISDGPSTQSIAQRLLKNQEQIGAAFAQFFGSEVGKTITDLLKEHILIAVDLITAARLTESKEFKTIDAKWHKNADAIAKALSDINPAWTFKELQKMLYEHLNLTLHELSAHLKKDWQGSIRAFDKALDQALELATLLAQGIVEQFPAQF